MALFAHAPLQRRRQPEPVLQRKRARLFDEPVRLRRILCEYKRGAVKQRTHSLKRTCALRAFLRQRLTFFYHPLSMIIHMNDIKMFRLCTIYTTDTQIYKQPAVFAH
jgi:hypothetical protein